MSEFPAHPFWDFSLEVYMTEGVPPACVVVQENHQIDVNILLYCCWLGASGRGVTTAGELDRLKQAVDPWHQNVVRSLRAIRGRLKDGMPPAPRDLSDSMRGRIAKIEIDCEHVEQLMLAASLEKEADESVAADRRASDAIANIDSYFDSLGIVIGPDDKAALLTVLRVAFNGLDEARLEALCDEMRVARAA